MNVMRKWEKKRKMRVTDKWVEAVMDENVEGVGNRV